MKTPTYFLLLPLLLICFLLSGCFGKGDPSAPLYFEPPSRLINNYTGMVEVEELNWAWTQPGFRLSNYANLHIIPVSNLSGVEEGTIQAHINEGLLRWCEKAGIGLADDAQLLCEGAIVELKVERTFLEKMDFFGEENQDFLVEAEFIIKEMPTRNILCKIRHGVTASERNQLAGLLLSGLTRFLEAHK